MRLVLRFRRGVSSISRAANRRDGKSIGGRARRVSWFMKARTDGMEPF
jgi:hypothetical protein